MDGSEVCEMLRHDIDLGIMVWLWMGVRFVDCYVMTVTSGLRTGTVNVAAHHFTSL